MERKQIPIVQLANGTPYERREAASQLWQIARDDPESATTAITTLEVALQDTDEQVRYLAIQTLGFLGGRAARSVPLLSELLGGSDLDIRYDAAMAIIAIEPTDRAVVTLVDILNDPGGQADRVVSIQRSVAKLGSLADKLVPMLIRNLGIPVVLVCTSAAEALRSTIGQTATESYLLDQLNSPEPIVRQCAVELLGSWNSNREVVRSALTKAVLWDQSNDVRYAAIDALRKIRCSDLYVVGVLKGAMQDADQIISIKSAGALLALGIEETAALLALSQGLQVDNNLILQHALLTIRGLPAAYLAKLSDDLVPLIGRNDEEVSELAAEAVARVGLPVIGALIQILDGRDLHAHYGAVRALGEMEVSSRDALLALLHVLARQEVYERAADAGEDTDYAILAIPGAAYKAVSKHVGRNDRAAIPYLLAGLQYENESVRVASAEGLGRIGGPTPSVLAALERLIKDQSEIVARAAARALEICRGQPLGIIQKGKEAQGNAAQGERKADATQTQ